MIQFKNIKATQQEALDTLSAADAGPAEPDNLAVLKQRLAAVKSTLPPICEKGACDPSVLRPVLRGQ